MALRSLIRRILVRSPTGYRMGAVHGTSPATAAGAPRFLATQSEGNQCISKKIMEQEEREARYWALVKSNKEEIMKAIERTSINHAERSGKYRRELDALKRQGTNGCIFGYASAAGMFGTTGYLMYSAREG